MTGRVLILALAVCVSGCQPEAGVGEAVSATPVSSPAASLDSGVDEGAVSAAWCRLTGSSDALLRCPVALTAQNPGSPAAGLQFSLSWDAAALSLVGLESDVCAPGGTPCATVMSPPMKAVGSGGHVLATRPIDLTTATGTATVMVYHPVNPDAVLPAQVGQLVFRARRPVDGLAVKVTEAVATSPQAVSMRVTAEANVLRVGL